MKVKTTVTVRTETVINNDVISAEQDMPLDTLLQVAAGAGKALKTLEGINLDTMGRSAKAMDVGEYMPCGCEAGFDTDGRCCIACGGTGRVPRSDP